MMNGGSGIAGMRKGPWTPEEDAILLEHVRKNGARNWSLIPFLGLLPRTGKSCRLRWVNKLRPGLKRGRKFTPEEEQRILNLQSQFGNKWATIAKYFPGRTDNDVKNFWSVHRKRLARAQHHEQTQLLGISNQVVNLETKGLTVASLQELHALEGEEQGVNNKGNSSGTMSSDIVEPQPDVNPTWSNPDPDPLPQPAPLDPFFDLPPLPEIHLLQPTPGPVNLTQDQYWQSTQFFESEPKLGSMDLGQAQCIDPNHHSLKCECMDWGLTQCLDTVPFFSHQWTEFDDLADMLDSKQPFFLFPP